MYYLFFVVFILFCVDFSFGKSGYLLTFPEELQIGASERFCVTFYSIDVDVSVNLTLSCYGKDKVHGPIIFSKGEDGCVSWQIPEFVPGTCNLHVDGAASDMQYRFNDSKEVKLVDTHYITFIQTDKPIYKPGQTVKFRILTSTQDLKPIQTKIESLVIKDPGNFHMKEWKQLDTRKGLVSLEYQLSREPVLGRWMIEVTVDKRKSEQVFSIQKYVLPKFEVSMKLPSLLTVETERLDFTICARYTYGKPVRGNVRAKVCLKNRETSVYCNRSNRPCVNLNTTLSGCHKFTVNTLGLLINMRAFSLLCRPRLVVEANVTETQTGITVEEIQEGPKVSQERLKLEFISKNYFKPFFPYIGKVKVMYPDGVPALAEEVKITSSKLGIEEILVSDREGIVTFTITNLTADTQAFYISAKSLDEEEIDPNVYTIYQASAGLRVKQWYSPSESYLFLKTSETTVPCGTQLPIEVQYSSVGASLPHRIFYKVVGRGNILHSEEITDLYVTSEDFLPPTQGQILQPEITTPAPPTDTSPTEATSDEDPNLTGARVQGPPGSLAGPAGPPPGDPPAPLRGSDITLTGETSYSMGHPVALTCVVTGITARSQEIYWYRGGTRLSNGPRLVINSVLDGNQRTSTLRIFRSEESDSGVYICRVPGLRIKSVSITVIDDGTAPALPDLDIVGPTDRVFRRLYFSLNVTSHMMPVARVLVYFVTYEGELVADALDVSVKPCFGNQVQLSYLQDKVQPGSDVTMSLSAVPGSLCGIGMVDKSVHLRSMNNLLQQEDIMKTLASYDMSSEWIPDWVYCTDSSPQAPLEPEPVGPPGEEEYERIPDGPPGFQGVDRLGTRRKRSIRQYPGSFYDSILAFKTTGLIAMTDLELETRPCVNRGGLAGPNTGDGDALYVPGVMVPGVDESEFPHNILADDEERVQVAPVSLRDYFPETWLWLLQEIPESGTLQVNQSIPHTVTEWVGNSICTSLEAGIGVSDLARVTSFQPFFLSFDLPYSLVRGELVSLNIVVFNYLDHCIMVQLILKRSAHFEVLSGGKRPKLCVCGSNAASYNYTITPVVLGNVNLTVTGNLLGYRHSCDGDHGLSDTLDTPITDTVTRQLLVEAEGIPEQKTFSSYICPQDSDGTYQNTIRPDLPSDLLVEDSLRGWVSVIGDIMGPVLVGVENLILLPTGCGEQTMLKFTPNLAVLDYLSSTYQLTEELQQRAIANLEIGYQEELKYLRDDGSYSAFGKSDESGSTWLSAYVFKSFRKAQDYIYLDRTQTQTKTWDYLLSRQGVDGCFQERGNILSKYMQGGVASSDNRKALTAYVLTAMLESFQMMRERTPPFVALALRCIDVVNQNDTYTLALSTYALSLYSPKSPAMDAAIEKLLAEAVIEDGKMYWQREDTPVINKYTRNAPSAEVEMTAYALLALLNKYENEPVETLIPIVRWLMEQRNANGGFTSTQDTVVGLQALSRFAGKVYGGGQDVTLTITDKMGHWKSFHVNNKNKLLLQKEEMDHVDSQLTVEASGEGCVLMQTSIHYNVKDIPVPELAFTLEVTTPVDVETLSNCRSRTVRVCSSYIGADGASSMAIIEVKMVSGWIPNATSLKKLLTLEEVKMKKFEMDNRHPDVVNFYFNQIDHIGVCFEFSILLELEVGNMQPASASVFDYYETDLLTRTFYNLSACNESEIIIVEESEDIFIEEGLDEDLDFDLDTRSKYFGVSGDLEEEVNMDIQSEQEKSICPHCVITGPINLFEDICNRQVIKITSHGDEADFQVMTPNSIHPGIKMEISPELLACRDCRALLKEGMTTLAVMKTEPIPGRAAGFGQFETTIIPWDQGLEVSVILALNKCS